MIRALDVTAKLLIAVIAVMILTGGAKFQTPVGKIEMSQLFAWVALLGLVTLARRGVRSPSPLRRALEKTSETLMSFHKPVRAFAIAIGGAALAFTLIHVLRHWSFHTHLFDQGVIEHFLTQSWSTRWFACDICPNADFRSAHLAYSLAAFASVAGIFRSHEVLFALQSAIVTLAITLLITRGPLQGDRFKWVLAFFILLCHPAIRTAWTWDFREDHVAFLGLSVAAVGAYRGSVAWLGIGSLVALLSKENMAFILPWLYAAAWLRYRLDRKATVHRTVALIAWLLVAAAWAWFSFRVLLPTYGSGAQGTHEIVLRFPGLGSTPEEVTRNLITRPWLLAALLLKKAFSKTGLHYLVLVLGPWAVLYFSRSAGRAWIWIFAAIPGLMMNLVSGAETQRSLQFHYDLVILPFLALAALEGLKRADRRGVVAALFVALLFSGRWPGLQLRENWPSGDDLARREWIERIPADGVLASNDLLFAQISLRDRIRYFPTPASAVSWEEFLKLNSEDVTRLPSHAAAYADWLLLDTARPSEAALAAAAAPGFELHSKSPDQRIVLLKRSRN